jgi:hypothetical protein
MEFGSGTALAVRARDLVTQARTSRNFPAEPRKVLVIHATSNPPPRQNITTSPETACTAHSPLSMIDR